MSKLIGSKTSFSVGAIIGSALIFLLENLEVIDGSICKVL